MRDWEDGEGPDPDYGVFGDAGMPRPPLPAPDPRRDAEVARQRARREQTERTAREFNSHMIHLYNEGRRK